MIEVGDLVVLPENSYLYGQGALTLRVTEVVGAVEPDWVQLVGHEVGWDGERVRQRAVVAKVAAVQAVRDAS